MTQQLHLESIENFRDFGGYGTACGRGIKRGVLFRSANHSNATQADLDTLHGLGITTIVDLRRPMEREREPSRRHPAFNGQVIENDTNVEGADWSIMLKEAPRIDADWFYEDSIAFYRAAPFEERHVDLFRRYFHAVAHADGGILVHFAAGKDRTGMICALTHHLAGVHRDDTLSDFLATNHPGRMTHRINFLGPWIKDLTGRHVEEDALRVAVSVHESYLDAALDQITKTSGSIDDYLENTLGVDAKLRDKIDARILG